MREEIKRNLLIVNSRDRKNGSSENFTYSLEGNSLEIEAISLKSASIPHTYTNVNSSNNILKYSIGNEIVLTDTYEGTIQVGGTIAEYTLDTGNVYTQTEMLFWLNRILNFPSNQLEIGYDEVAGRYTATTNNNIPSPFIMSDYVFNPSYPRLWEALGFVTPITLANTAGVTITATNAPTAPFNVGPVQYVEVPIDVGQYTVAELAPLVVAALSINLSGLSLTIISSGPDKGKVQINGAGQTWKFEDCDIAHFLGFRSSEMPYALNHTAPYLPDMLANRYLYIASNTLANGYNCLQKNGEKTSILGTVPVCSTYGSKDTWEANYPIIKKYDGSINISEIDVQILDENNKPIPLGNADVVLVFEVWATIRL